MWLLAGKVIHQWSLRVRDVWSSFHHHPGVRTFEFCVTVHFGNKTPLAEFPFANELDDDRHGCVPCYIIVRVTEHLPHVHHIALVYCFHA